MNKCYQKDCIDNHLLVLVFGEVGPQAEQLASEPAHTHTHTHRYISYHTEEHTSHYIYHRKHK